MDVICVSLYPLVCGDSLLTAVITPPIHIHTLYRPKWVIQMGIKYMKSDFENDLPVFGQIQYIILLVVTLLSCLRR